VNSTAKGRALEKRVERLLPYLGWQEVRRSGGAGDGGVDVRGILNGERWIVQCKNHERRIDPTHVRDLAGAFDYARKFGQAERALFITTSRYSHKTRQWAREMNIELWDGTRLRSYERQFNLRPRFEWGRLLLQFVAGMIPIALVVFLVFILPTINKPDRTPVLSIPVAAASPVPALSAAPNVPSAAPSIPPFTRRMWYEPGMRQQIEGSDVLLVQQRLAELGYADYTPGGHYGPKTVAAVIAFQQAHGLEADGIVGPVTWETLFSQPTR
jgi:Holliday junction resolvase